MFAKMGALSDYSKWAEEEGRYHRESFDLISPFIISTQYKADASPLPISSSPHLLFPQRIMSPASSLSQWPFCSPYEWWMFRRSLSCTLGAPHRGLG
jgi:hypothetical protein